MPSSSPVRIQRAALNLSLPDDHDRQRFSRRFEQALRSSLRAIPDRLLPQVEETLHLGTLNLDLGELDLNNWSRLEGLFQERLQQRLLALLKQAARAARPAATTAARSYPKPVVEPETITVRQSTRSRVINNVRQQLLKLLELTGKAQATASSEAIDSGVKIKKTGAKEIGALCDDLTSVAQGTRLSRDLRTALAQLVADMQCWLSPKADTAYALTEITRCLQVLQQTCAEFTREQGSSDEQLMLQVLDKSLQASEPGKPVTDVSCIALEGALSALVIRRQLSPAVASRLGLWLARQTQLTPALRLRRMLALHRYLRSHSGKSGELITVLGRGDRVELMEGVKHQNRQQLVEPPLTESKAMMDREYLMSAAQVSSGNQSLPAEAYPNAPQEEDRTTEITAGSRVKQLLDGSDATRQQSSEAYSGQFVERALTQPEQVIPPRIVSSARIQWLVDTLLCDPQLSCHLAVSIRQWQQHYEQLSPLSRYRWLKTVLAEIKKGREVVDTETPLQQNSSKTTVSVQLEWRRLRQLVAASWASAPVHTLHADWWRVVEPLSNMLPEVEDRLQLSRVIQELFVVASVAAEQHTGMATWIRRHRKRWRQWLRRLNPAAPDLSFTQREQLWPEPQEALPGWSSGALVLELEQKLINSRLKLSRCQRALASLKPMLEAGKNSSAQQLVTSAQDWLTTLPPLSASCQQAIEQQLLQVDKQTSLGLQKGLKASGKLLEQEARIESGLLNQWRQLAVAVLNRQPSAEISTLAASLPLAPAPESNSPVRRSTTLSETLIEQGKKLLSDLKQALRPVRVYPLEHDYLVPDSGLVLFWPHLQRLYKPLQDDNQQWLSPQHQQQALAHLLYLGNTSPDEDDRSPVAALLVGLSPDTPMHDLPALSSSQQAACDLLLNTVIKQWRALKEMTATGLQQLFLQRTGYLDQTANGWRLTTEHQPQDILMQALPWPVSVVHLPWMEHLLAVEWHTGPTGLWKPFQ